MNMIDRVTEEYFTEDFAAYKTEKEDGNKEKPRCTAIILAAGSGSRMHSAVAKQFLPLKGRPLIWYALHAVEESKIIDDCILVTSEQDIPYVREEIVQKYHFTKVNIITSGGAERYLSVSRALQLIADGRLKCPNEHGYVFIHDGARPFLTEKILEDTYAAAVQYQACVAAVQSKDTVKISDGNGFALSTPDRRSVWNIQTPQVFETSLILQAYERLKNRLPKLQEQGIESTQATISRDIKQLHLIKEPVGGGRYRYAVSAQKIKLNFAGRLQVILRESILSADRAQNLVVVKMMPGLGPAAGSAFDGMEIPAIVGTVSGDDTVLVVLRDEQSAAEFCTELTAMIK